MHDARPTTDDRAERAEESRSVLGDSECLFQASHFDDCVIHG
jgi:hypothetical protein